MVEFNTFKLHMAIKTSFFFLIFALNSDEYLYIENLVLAEDIEKEKSK